MSSTEVNLDLEAAEALRKARELMNDEGKHWYQGDWTEMLADGSVAYCAVGALRQITGSSDNAVLRRAIDILCSEQSIVEYTLEHYGEDTDSIGSQDRIINWNDSDSRSWDEVAATFAAAEAKLRGAPEQPAGA